MKYRIKAVKHRKAGSPLLLLLTDEEHEYLKRIVLDRGGNMAFYMRGKAFIKGWRRELEELRSEQGPLDIYLKV